MEYKLFEEILFTPPSTAQRTWNLHIAGGAIQIIFISEYSVYFNGELESRRGKKLRIGDKIDIPDMNIDILLTQPTSEEQEEYQADKVDKERIAKLVKEMNKGVKKDKSKPTSSTKSKPAPRFPGR